MIQLINNKSIKSAFSELTKLSKSETAKRKLSFKFESEFLNYQPFLKDFSSQHYQIFNEIKKLKPGKGNEIHITDAIKNLITNGHNFFANIFKGKYLDCGTMNGYVNSGIEISKGIK